MALLIIFEVRDERRRRAVIAAIEHYGSCLRLGESSYAVKTSDSPTQVYSGLQRHLGSDEHLLVLPLQKPYTGGNARVKQWLDDNLTG